MTMGRHSLWLGEEQGTSEGRNRQNLGSNGSFGSIATDQREFAAHRPLGCKKCVQVEYTTVLLSHRRGKKCGRYRVPTLGRGQPLTSPDAKRLYKCEFVNPTKAPHSRSAGRVA